MVILAVRNNNNNKKTNDLLAIIKTLNLSVSCTGETREGACPAISIVTNTGTWF